MKNKLLKTSGNHTSITGQEPTTDMFPEKNQTGTRYSDEELEEFKELINGKLNETKRNYTLLREAISLKDNNGTDDTSPTFKLMEDSGDHLNKEEMAQYALRQLKYIEHLENALIRINNKTYGICHVTGRLIPKERLKSVPHSTMCIDAKKDARK